MPSYAYKAVHASGRVARGNIVSVNENELASYLSESGLELIEARERDETRLSLPLLRAVPPRTVAAFCTRLHDLLISGIPFLDTLRDVTDATDNRALREALAHIACAIQNGGGIASSFALYPRLFPPVFTAVIEAGERSGNMGAAFGYLSRYADMRATTEERLRRALRYPLFLFFVAGSAVGFMLITVVPQVVQFLNGLQEKLPVATRLLLGVSAAIAAHGPAILGALIVLAGMIYAARALSPAFAVKCDGIALRLPFIGAVIAKSSLARFAHSFAILFRSGCKAPDCLRQARGTVSNRALQVGIESAERRLHEGAALSQAFDNVLPPFALGMLRTGERSGDLGKSLDDLAVAYDREAQAATDAFIGILEPALTLAIGMVMIWTVMAVLGPLYSSLSVLGKRM
ncbi:MAG: type II secretion system F family protein [Alphaproteobacteria bacterium]|nr:type II secretion system F family protein [Alphaproteobacteria bacterium]